MKQVFLLTVVFFATLQIAQATPLEQAMKKMGAAYKELATDLQKPQDTDKDKYLQLAATIKSQAQISHDLAPKLADTLPPDQRDAMVKSYQKDMDTFMQSVDSLSAALQNGKWDDALKLMATLKQEMGDGHKEYRAKH